MQGHRCLFARISAVTCVLGLAGLVSAVETETQKLPDPDHDVGARFGCAVVVDGAFAAVGKSSDSTFHPANGAVYTYERVGDTWTNTQKLYAPDAAADARFGEKIALSGEWLLVATAGDDDLGWFAGAVYAFRYEASSWSFVQKFYASDGNPYQRFGSDVAVDGTTAVIGASSDDDLGVSTGAAYIFTWDGVDWVEQTKITVEYAGPQANVGSQVEIDGDVVALGVASHDKPASNTGCVYVYRFDGANWLQEQKLTALDATDAMYLGYSVSVDGDWLIAGAFGVSESTGAAYVFRHTDSAWTQTQKILPPANDEIDDYFGTKVALDGKRAIVTAIEPYQSPTAEFGDGFAVAYELQGLTWYERTVLVASDAEGRDEFGCAADLDGTTSFIGAWHGHADPFDPTTWREGKAYTFDLDFGLCPEDLDGSTEVGFADLTMLLDSWGLCDCPEDLDSNGSVGFSDLVQLITDWGPCQ